MLLFHEEVFDEIISGSGPWYTSETFNRLIGSAELLSIMAFTTSAPGTPTLNVYHDVSAEDQNWVLATTATITGAIANNLLMQGTAGATMPFGRLRITLTGSNLQCRLKLSVTGRSV